MHSYDESELVQQVLTVSLKLPVLGGPQLACQSAQSLFSMKQEIPKSQVRSKKTLKLPHHAT